MTRRDFGYILGYLVYTIIVILVFHYGGKDSEIVSYFGFAASLIATILSILAIIYTVLQSTSSVAQSARLLETSMALNTNSQKLTETSERFSAVVNESRTTQAQLAAAVQSFSALDRKVEEYQHAVTDMFQRAGTPQGTSAHLSVTELEKAISTASPVGLIVLILAHQQHLRPLHMDLPHIIEKINPLLPEQLGYRFDPIYAYGFLMGFTATGGFSVGAGDELTVKFHDPEAFGRALDAILERRLADTDPLYSEFYKAGQAAVQQLYAA